MKYYLINSTGKCYESKTEIPIVPYKKEDLVYEHYLQDMETWESNLVEIDMIKSNGSYLFIDENGREIAFSEGGDITSISKQDYVQFVTELEAKAMELWPELFNDKCNECDCKGYLRQDADGGTTWVEQTLGL